MKICVIKLGAKGDVVRTIPVVKALADKYKGAEIVWVTKRNIVDLLQGLEFVSRFETLPCVLEEEFDFLYNFDFDDEAVDFAENTSAGKKFGFCKNEGFVSAWNFGAEYYLSTIFDDEIKKNNKRTYQEMMFQVAEMEYKKENVGIVLNEKDREYAKKFFGDRNIGKLIGIHLGASPRWPSKAWHEDNLKEFIRKASEKDYRVMLFGGPDEMERFEKFIAELSSEGIEALKNNPANTNREFAALVERCDVMVCGDSFALHVALGLKKKTVGLFFCTSHHEVEGYGLLKKIASKKLDDFFPERMDEYDEELVKSISADEVLREVEKS